MSTLAPTSVRHVQWMRRNGLLPPDTSPRRMLACSVDGCGEAWYETQTWDSVRGEVVSFDHDGACRRARIAGWTGDGRTTCLCGNHDLRCPDHALPADLSRAQEN